MQPETPQSFDPKSILDALMRDGAQPASEQGQLGDLLRQSMPGNQGSQPVEGATKQSGPDHSGAQDVPKPQSKDSLEDMLRNAMGNQPGGLSDLLAKLQQQGGSFADILGQVLGQATSGVREGFVTSDGPHTRGVVGTGEAASRQQPIGCGRCSWGPWRLDPGHGGRPVSGWERCQTRQPRAHWWPRLQVLSKLSAGSPIADRGTVPTAGSPSGTRRIRV
jgi:hypothetical protein